MNCPKCHAKNCRCELTDGERSMLAAADSAKPKKQREGTAKGKKVAGIKTVARSMARRGYGVGHTEY